MSEPTSSSGRKSWWTWIRISEVVGVVAVLIAILNFWDNHAEHRLAEKERQTADQRAASGPAFVLVGSADNDGALIHLSPVHGEQPIQSQVFFFPTTVRDKPVAITGAARLEAAWIAGGLRKVSGKIGGDPGDLRLPVGIATTYLADGETRTDASIYDLGYRIEPRFLRSGRVVLEGLSVARRGVRGDLQAATQQLYHARGGAEP